MTVLEDQLRASLHAAAERTAVPLPPSSPTRAGRRAPRRLRVAALLAVSVPTAAALAAAGGYLPGSLESAFSFADTEGIGSSTLQIIGAVPGPPGERLELWTRTGDTGRTCFLTALVPDAQPAGTPADTIRTSSGSCEQSVASPLPFGAEGGGSERTFIYSAGSAVRAEVLLTDGTHLAAVTAGGQVAGWVPVDRREDAVLVGYDAAGSLLATIDLTPWDPPPVVPSSSDH